MRGTLHEAVLFDLDGTLLDTLADLGNSMNRVLAAHALPTHPLDAYRQFVGDGVLKLIERSLPPQLRQDRKLFESCLAEYKQDYGRNWKVDTRPYPGIPELLDALTTRGIKLAVLSNKPDEFTQLCVQDLLAQWRFDATVGASSAFPHKPDPASTLAVARRLSLAPARFLYVGDTAVDMQTARAAGMTAIGALWGFRGREELVHGGAQFLVQQPPQVLELLDRRAPD